MAETNQTPDFLITVGADPDQIANNVLDSINKAIEKINSDPNSITKIQTPFGDSSVSSQLTETFRKIKSDTEAISSQLVNSFKALSSVQIQGQVSSSQGNKHSAVDSALKDTVEFEKRIASAYTRLDKLVGNSKLSQASATKYLETINKNYKARFDWANKLNEQEKQHYQEQIERVKRTADYKENAAQIGKWQQKYGVSAEDGVSFSTDLFKSLPSKGSDSRILKSVELPDYSSLLANQTAEELNNEAKAVDEVNKLLLQHSRVLESAVAAEADKAKQSTRTADSLGDEGEAFDKATQKAQQHIKVVKPMSLSAGAFRDEDANKVIEAAQSTITKQLGDGYTLKEVEVSKVVDEDSIKRLTGSLTYYNQVKDETIKQSFKATKASDDENDSNYELTLTNEKVRRSYDDAAKSRASFNAAAAKRVAQAKVDTLQAEITAKGYSDKDAEVFTIKDTQLAESFESLDVSIIKDKDSLKDFNSYLDVCHERIRALGQEAKGLNTMDPAAALSNAAEQMPKKLDGLAFRMKKLKDAPEDVIDAYNRAKETLDSFGTAKKRAALSQSELTKRMKEAQSQISAFRQEIANAEQSQKTLLQKTLDSFSSGKASSQKTGLVGNLDVLNSKSTGDSAAVDYRSNIIASYNELNGAISEYNRLLTSGDEGEAHNKELGEQAAKVEELARNYNELFIQVKNYAAAQKSGNVSSTTLANNNRDLQELRTTIANFRRNNGNIQQNDLLNFRLSDLEKAVQVSSAGSEEIAKWRTELSSISESVTQLGLKGQTFAQRVKSQVSKLLTYSTGVAILGGSVMQLKKMVSTVIAVDDAMTDLKKVTEETDSAYVKFLDNATVRAKNLGASLSDVIIATSTFAKMGYSLSASEVSADAALIAQNVWDNVGSIDETANTIISASKAFGIAASNAMSIVDTYNEVSNTQAVVSGHIANAMADSGAALSAGGNSFAESVALFTATNEIIQDWSKASAALRTLTSRLRNTSGELEEMGIDSDGAAESITQLQQRIYKLSKVDIMASATEFKTTTQILRELAAVWDTLSDVDQAELTRYISGTRQASVFSALIKNFPTVDTVLATIADSEGRQYRPCVQKCA